MAKSASPAKSSKAPATRPDGGGGRAGPNPGKAAAQSARAAQKPTSQNDRAAENQSGLGSRASERDMTSGKHSGNQ